MEVLGIEDPLGSFAPAAARPGDVPAAAIAALYGELEPMVRRLCTVYLGNLDDAEDATQETFVRLSGRLNGLKGDPRWYALRVARNICCEERQRRRRSTAAASRWAGGMLDCSEHELARTESRDLLRRIRNHLSREELLVFNWVAEGLSVAEIAQRVGTTESALGVRLCRARKRMRMLFGAAAAVAGVAVVVGRAAARILRRAAIARPRGSLALIGAPVTLLSAAALGSLGLAVLYGQVHAAPNAVVPLAGAATRASLPALRGGSATRSPVPDAAGTSRGGSQVDHAVTAGRLANAFTSPSTQASIATTDFTSIVASPAYASDHTIYAAGSNTKGCGNPALCYVLFRSTDGGRSWELLPATGFGGGTVLLPPSYPTDPAVFATGALGLQRSDDGGRTFRVVVPGAAPAAVSPLSSPGDARILVGSNPLLVYDGATGAVTPGPELPAGAGEPDSLSYAGRSGVVFVTAETLDPVGTATGGSAAEIIRCDASGTCGVVFRRPGVEGLNLVTDGSFDSDRTVLAFAAGTLARSSDAGMSFSAVAATGSYAWQSVAAGGGATSGLVFSFARTGSTGQLLVSRDGAATFSAVAPGLRGVADVSALVVLPDGSLLTSTRIDDSSTFLGLQCSTDQGQHWRNTC